MGAPMFRLFRLKPPNGWGAVAWELGIVTAGVLIALGVQQWADERSWKAKASQSLGAIRDELAKHYSWSVEWRVVAPCVRGQIEQRAAMLEWSVILSGVRLSMARNIGVACRSEMVWHSRHSLCERSGSFAGTLAFRRGRG